MMLLASWLLQACGGDTSKKNKGNAGSARTVNNTTSKMGRIVQQPDKQFLTDTASNIITEVELAKIAWARGSDNAVKNFGAYFEYNRRRFITMRRTVASIS